MSESKNKFSKENPKGVIYTHTAIGFDSLNPDLLKEQKEELLLIFGRNVIEKQIDTKTKKKL